MVVKRVRTLFAVTATGGAAQSFYTSSVLSGTVKTVRFLNGPATAPSTAAGSLATVAHLAITAELSGLSILDCTCTASGVTYHPRDVAKSTTGALFSAATGAGAVVGMPVEIPVAAERVKFTVTSGGAASGVAGGLLGACDLYLDGIA